MQAVKGYRKFLIPAIKVPSSNIKSIGYDMDRKLLQITFHSDAIYQYADVPFEEFAKLISAKSIGQYFAAYIRNEYKYTMIRDKPQDDYKRISKQ